MVKIFDQLDPAKRRHGKTVVGEKRFLAQTILRRVKNVPPRVHRNKLCGGFDRRRRNIFELERHNIDATRKNTHGIEVVIIGGGFDVGYLPGRVSLSGENVWTR